MEFPAKQEVEAELIRRGQMKRPRLFHWSQEPSPEFVTIGDGGLPVVHAHPGQWKAKESTERFVLVLSGAQSGKTAIGPWWLLDEMQNRGPGNYLLVAPTFRLLAKQAIPSLLRAFSTLLDLGRLVEGKSGEFHVSPEGHDRLWPDLDYEPTRIVFGYAENPDSLESITAKAAWLDEVGQRSFKRESHEAVQSRLAINEGRILYTTTPYEHGWLKAEVYDRADRYRQAVKDKLPPNPADAGYEAVSYESRMNPVFPAAEWERQKLVMPGWRFDMRYRGLFTRPAGAIYDCFVNDAPDRGGHVIKCEPGFKPPEGWPIYCGIDFGAPNFAAVFLYENMMEIDGAGPLRPGEQPKLKKSGQYVAFAEYRPNESRTSAQHVEAMRKIIGGNPTLCVGGAKSEGQWRKEFANAGWPIREPDQKEVEVGISRVYALFAENRLFIMDSCPGLLDEIQAYSREVDENGEPISDTIMDKETYHGADSVRYIGSWLNRPPGGAAVRMIDY